MASEVTVDPYDLCTGSPPQAPSSGKKSWDELRRSVRDTRKLLTTLVSTVPSCFTFRTIATETGDATRLYFLGVPVKGRESTLLYVDVPRYSDEHGALCNSLPWKHLLDSFQPTLPTGLLSREERLMRERKRLGAYGITSYDVAPDNGTFVFPACNSLFECTDSSPLEECPVLPSCVSTNCPGARLDPKICPLDSHLVAFIHNSDIWVSHLKSGDEQRLTFAHKDTGSLSSDPVTAGVASFIVQEEFDRYTAYWWMPSVTQSTAGVCVYRILYEEVDESDVEIVNIFTPTEEKGIDTYRYPRAGTANARTVLKIVEFEVDEHGKIVDTIVERQMLEPLSTVCPWMEYIVRVDWTPDAKFVYVQVLDRPQLQTAVYLIPFENFLPVMSDVEMGSFDSSSYLPLQMIYKESSDIWINVHDIIHFFPQSRPDEISFLWSSEKSGFRHLYHVTSQLHSSPDQTHCSMELDEKPLECLQCRILQEVPLTVGDWEVNSKQFWVDEKRKLVYFMGLKDTPLEKHLYVVSYVRPRDPKRLTQAELSHSVYMNKACTMFVTVYSSIKQTPRSKIFEILHNDDVHIHTELLGTVIGPTACLDYRPPELFEFPSRSDHTLHGMFYRPHNYEAGAKYPTVLFVYGGPQVQLVTNAFKGLKFLRLHTLASQGYVVVVVDGRGSCCRGLQFEGYIKNKLGTVEIEEQVEGLLWLAGQTNMIDLARIAIHGWSYGGYLSLLGLAQRPDIFKVAIAGAPVVNWALYDTGYTERYLDLPEVNKQGYQNGSVLSYVDSLPDEENHLLIIHGLIDENVHFQHTSCLINALVRACKPYQLQVYPNERHGIRSHEASEHYKTMVMSFLHNNL
ncbi:dipeptidyl peptidase 9-like [Gigantopelta aegis]|uniref:dipeptidyl peptidase 9-like n=1 Tax=Gigantopelta aegis TaxID=1735272 RepID=UPI001B8879FC|nr:dipeptidyl peptidase 9-like [Gigantopelta aegis]XP_041356251.1 dipeptidyl peptidase 9-like [Gigantopelta aegis]